MDLSLIYTSVCCILSSTFAIGAFYSTTNFRIKKIEERQQEQDDTRERLIAIETKLEILIKKV